MQRSCTQPDQHDHSGCQLGSCKARLLSTHSPGDAVQPTALPHRLRYRCSTSARPCHLSGSGSRLLVSTCSTTRRVAQRMTAPAKPECGPAARLRHFLCAHCNCRFPSLAGAQPAQPHTWQQEHVSAHLQRGDHHRQLSLLRPLDAAPHTHNVAAAGARGMWQA